MYLVMIWIFLEFNIMQLLNLKESFILKISYKQAQNLCIDE